MCVYYRSSFFTMLLLGVPLGWLLCHWARPVLGLPGVWLGISVGVWLQGVLLWFLACSLDWKQEKRIDTIRRLSRRTELRIHGVKTHATRTVELADSTHMTQQVSRSARSDKSMRSVRSVDDPSSDTEEEESKRHLLRGTHSRSLSSNRHRRHRVLGS